MKETPHLKAAKPEIAAFFAAHADDEERTAYIERIFNDDYTELLIGSDERRVGYKTYQNVLHLWEGSYLSRTSESFYDWGVIAAYYGTMLVMDEFLDDATPDGQLLLTAVPEKKAIPDAAIDAALQRNGSGFEGGKYRIYAYFSENHTARERAEFLKDEFGIGGICPALPGSRLDEWHDSKGIRFARGDSSGTQVEIRLSWSQLQSRIMGLITSDHYLTLREKADMPAYQQHAEQKRREAAERDADWKSAHAASPTIQPFQKPDADLRTDAPAKPTPPSTVQMSLFPTAKQQQIEITQAEDAKSSAFSLAQDDINQVLCAGSLFQNGKFRIAEQFTRHQSAKINADFLKNEYGLSGGSLTFSDETSGQVQYTAKGISIYKSRRGSEPDKFLPWADAEKLIRALIETDRYLTPEERTAYTAWKKERTEALASAEQLHAHNTFPVTCAQNCGWQKRLRKCAPILRSRLRPTSWRWKRCSLKT